MLDLAVVMPVYNEEECIEQVLREWLAQLESLKINFSIIVLDDGSTDKTGVKLDQFRSESRVDVVSKSNTGHGPTILSGYGKACKIAEWVFQCDSDNEIPASEFIALWRVRSGHETVLGHRIRPGQPFQRKVISWAASVTVASLFGRGIADVNVPFRLLRSDILSQIISNIPKDTFAPNVAIAGALAKRKSQISIVPVFYQPRKTGKVSIMSARLWKASVKSFFQTVRIVKSLDT